MISVWILGDQLLADHPALAEAERQARREGVCVLLIESRARIGQMPYQRKKLVLLLSAMRHYAQALREQGYAVEYVQAESFLAGLRQHAGRRRPDRILAMAASGYDGRQEQRDLAGQLAPPLEVLANTQFLVGQHDPIPAPQPGKQVVMEQFYRAMRRHWAVLMDGPQPQGGRWNLDAENRKRLPRGAQPPPDLTFAPDEITRQVMAEVAALPPGVGSTHGFAYAVTREQALAALAAFVAQRLPWFGPYEDALSAASHSLYHSLLSPYLNIGLLTPLEVARAAEQAYLEGRAPLNSAEGFVRQVIGWREFMYWQYWRQMPGLLEQNAWHARRPLPAFVWSADTDMACLRRAIRRALDTGYNHHIERLMVLCNFFLLAGIEPKAVNDWFLTVYIDAYDWVMPPNVLGMGLNADGGQTATKPYIASANYIHRMGDLCAICRYEPRQRSGEGACPYNLLYWRFVIEHEARLRTNPRTSQLALGLRHLDAEERRRVQAQAEAFLANLS
jgi:deoxyribodipyrimidine photolyase-related protein